VVEGSLTGILFETNNGDDRRNGQNTGKPFEKALAGLPVSDFVNGRLINLRPLVEAFQA
jgi:hypothetical protein